LLLPPTRPRNTTLRLPTSPTMSLPKITITKLDLQRLGSLLQEVPTRDERAVERLDEELARAQVVEPQVAPDDLVTMNSRVRYVDEVAGVTREITLVYPDDADRDGSRVSVLSPVGSALLGLRVGQTIEWPTVNGRRGRFRVLALPYQPESAGHFHL